MSDLGKIINNELVLCKEAERKVVTVSNPTDNMLKCIFGYKDIIYSETPEYDETIQRLKEVYTENNDTIQVEYIVEDISEEELNAYPDFISDEESVRTDE